MKATLYSPKKSIIIDLSVQPEPQKPEWSKGTFLDGIKNSGSIELPLVTSMTWQHPFQSKNPVSGSYILNGLASAYGSQTIKDWARTAKPCPVTGDDSINAHYGLKALLWLKDNWLHLPPSQKHCLTGKTIFGLADIMFDDAGGMSMPYVSFTTEKPTFGWYGLSHRLGQNDRFLVNPRAAALASRPVAEFIS